MNSWEAVCVAKDPDCVGSDSTQRLKIEGGWLYRNVLLEERANLPGHLETTIALCFVPNQ